MLDLPLFDYQEKTIEWMIRHPYSILALDLGMGKSACVIGIKDKLPKENHLIVCPSFLALNWKKEIQKFLKNQNITYFKSSKEVYYPVDSDFVIVSYDIAIKHEFLFEWATSIAFDEATSLKSMEAIRTQKIHQFVFENSIKRCHFLTGTPIKNRVKEFYSMMALCNYNPEIEKSEFLERFTNDIDFADFFSHRIEYDRWINGKVITITKWEGVKNEDQLKKYLQGIYWRIKSDLPEISRYPIFVDDCKDQKLLEAFLSWKEEGSSSVNPTAKMEAALKKAPLTEKYVKGLIDNDMVEGPIVIFTDHVNSCLHLSTAFGVEPITGQTSVPARQRLVDAFQKGEIPVLVGTYGALSHGFTLTASNRIVQNDYPWDPGTLKQAEFRINRKGQTRSCRVDQILGSDQDEYILNVILQKQEVLNAVY